MEILGCRLDPIDADAATGAIFGFVREKTGAQVVTLGTEMVVYAQNDRRFRDVVNACALSLCDTVGLLTVARKRGATLTQRVTGVELIEHLCARAAAETSMGTGDASVYLFGAAEGVAAEAAAALQARYPGLRVAGTRSGFFTSDESASIVETIRASGADLLFVGLGSPRQEFWLAEHLKATGAGAGIGVGGSFDVIAGRVERAPEAWRKLNLEWLYRLVKEPKRWRRQLALPQFVWLIARDRRGDRSKENVS